MAIFFIFAIAWLILVGWLANYRGREWPMWVILSLFISPLITTVVLLVLPEETHTSREMSGIVDEKRRRQKADRVPETPAAREMYEEEKRFRESSLANRKQP